MSILSTKPSYFQTAVATESGWINPITKELLVSVGGLKSKLEKEYADLKIKSKDTAKEQSPETITPEIPMTSTIQEPTKKAKKAKVIGEVTIKQPTQNQKLIGEVVEYNVETPVITE